MDYLLKKVLLLNHLSTVKLHQKVSCVIDVFIKVLSGLNPFLFFPAKILKIEDGMFLNKIGIDFWLLICDDFVFF